MIGKLNAWYDGVREPWRFLLALLLSSAGLTLLSLPSLPCKLLGVLYFFVLFAARMVGGRR